MIITMSLLADLGACSEHVSKFRTAFPDGLTITGEPGVDTINQIVTSGLDLDWFAQRVLTAPAYAEYQRVGAPAYAEYERVTAPAYAEYQRVGAAADAKYERVGAAAYAEYERVRAPAYAEYQRVRADTLWCLLVDPANLKCAA